MTEPTAAPHPASPGRPAWRWLGLFGAAVILTLVAGFGPDAEDAGRAFITSGYWFVLAAVLLWLLALARVFGRAALTAGRRHTPALLVCLALVGGMLTLSPPRFRVLEDEPVLAGVAMRLHDARRAELPLGGVYEHGRRDELTTMLDKRPLLYPFLVATLHDLTGVRVTNSFAANALIGISLLFLFYLLLLRFVPRGLALAGLVVFAAMPIVVLSVTSGGFEAVNLLFVLVTLLALHELLVRRHAAAFELLLLSLVLLGHCRYESVLFGLVLVVAVRPALDPAVLGRVPLGTALTPLLALPLLWQRQALAGLPLQVAGLFGVEEVPNLAAAFGLDPLLKHLPANIYVMTGFEPDLGFSLALFLLATLGACVLLVRLLERRVTDDTRRRFLLASALGFGTTLLLLSAYRWGELGDPVSNRLGLAFAPAVVGLAVYAVAWLWPRMKPVGRVLVLVAALFELALGWAWAAVDPLGVEAPLPTEYRAGVALLAAHAPDARRTLVVTHTPNLYLIHGYGAVSFADAEPLLRQHADTVLGLFDRVVLLSRVGYGDRERNTIDLLPSAALARPLAIACFSERFYLELGELDADERPPGR